MNICTDLNELLHSIIHDHQRPTDQMHHAVSNGNVSFNDFRFYGSSRVDAITDHGVTAYEI